MEHCIYNALKFLEGDSEHLMTVFVMLLINNNIPYNIDDEGILVFPSDKVLNFNELVSISSKYPDIFIFWSWTSEINQSQAFFRIKDGKVLKKKIKNSSPELC